MAKEYIEREAVLRHRRKMSGADFGGEFWDEAVLCEDIRKIPTADVVEVDKLTPCDVCMYSPPSSCDGKPCCMCPAVAKMDGGNKNG